VGIKPTLDAAGCSGPDTIIAGIGLEVGLHFVPTAAAETVDPTPSIDSVSVPVWAGSANEISSKMTMPFSMVVIAKEKLDPSDEVQPVPVEGEFVLFCGVKPVHGLHLPLGGTTNPRPTKV
jgi:hypothetical protein